ncbi:MAG: YceI family protein [Reichenbachiella sp.]
MKKSILVLAVIGTIVLNSCSNNGEKAVVQEAKEVTTSKNAETIVYNQISNQSVVDWRASHLGGAQPRFGKINLTSAEVLVNNRVLDNASVIMDMSSFTVENFPAGDENIAKLTGHLQSADFFNVAVHPTATFVLSKIENAEGAFNSVLTGNLTIMGISKSVSYKANVSITDTEVSIKSEDFSIDRSEWNLTYNAEGTEGVPVDYLISNDIGFTIDVAISKS